MIEHAFDLVKTPARMSGSDDGPKIASAPAKQNRPFRRLTAVKRTPSGLLAVTLRTGLLVGFAVLLILVLFPAAIAAQAAGLR